MRTISIALAAAATIGFASLAHAQTGGGMRPDTGAAQNTQGAPGSMGNTQGGAQTNNPTGGASPRAGTTGQGGVGGAVGGNAQRPGGTNTEQTGTQSHYAQKGGSGKDGAR
jgi:hypothetical protein